MFFHFSSARKDFLLRHAKNPARCAGFLVS